jgi:hypothetical protein
MNVTIKDIPTNDWELGLRAARRLLTGGGQDAILSYSDGELMKDFYCKRTKTGVTVRPCGPYAERSIPQD